RDAGTLSEEELDQVSAARTNPRRSASAPRLPGAVRRIRHNHEGLIMCFESTAMLRSAVSPAERLERVGAELLRWSLVLLLVLFRVIKWTAEEATAIHAFIANSPILFWVDRAFGQQGASEFIGVMELTTAALLASRRWSPRLALVGGLLGIGTFLTTLSF